MNYPYQDRFQLFLNQQGLAPLTIKTYDATLTHFLLFSWIIDQNSLPNQN